MRAFFITNTRVRNTRRRVVRTDVINNQTTPNLSKFLEAGSGRTVRCCEDFRALRRRILSPGTGYRLSTSKGYRLSIT